MLQGLARDLHKRGGLDLSECFLDGSFSAAKKGGFKVGKTKRGKGCKIMAIGDAHGLPIAIQELLRLGASLFVQRLRKLLET